MPQKKPTVEVRSRVLHEGGYKCANPTCRHVLTLDIHHMILVSKGGPNEPSNLLALCPNCHALHHSGEIPETSIRAWKFLLMSLNEAFDRRSVDVLLALDRLEDVYVSGDGLLNCAGLIASDLIYWAHCRSDDDAHTGYVIRLTPRGKTFVAGWKKGDQTLALPFSSLPTA